MLANAATELLPLIGRLPERPGCHQRAYGVTMRVIAVTGGEQFNDHASYGSGRAA